MDYIKTEISLFPLFDGIDSLSKQSFNKYLYSIFPHKSTYQVEEEGDTPMRIAMLSEKLNKGGPISGFKSACNAWGES